MLTHFLPDAREKQRASRSPPGRLSSQAAQVLVDLPHAQTLELVLLGMSSASSDRTQEAWNSLRVGPAVSGATKDPDTLSFPAASLQPVGT